MSDQDPPTLTADEIAAGPASASEPGAAAPDPDPAATDTADRIRQVRSIVVLCIIVGAVIAVMSVAGSRLVDLVRAHSPETRKASTTTAAPTTTKAPALAAGLPCDALAAQPLAYEHVVAYWLRTASPRDLDRDRDDRPCDDVYDEGVVDQFWSVAEALPSKASCENLVESGVAYPDVIAYWLRRDRTSKLVADDEALPCTDVYPPHDIYAYIQFDA